jgi:hypothetical protein
MRHFVLYLTYARPMPNHARPKNEHVRDDHSGARQENSAQLGKNDTRGTHTVPTIMLSARSSTCPPNKSVFGSPATPRVAEQVKVCVILGLVVGHGDKAN